MDLLFVAWHVVVVVEVCTLVDNVVVEAWYHSHILAHSQVVAKIVIVVSRNECCLETDHYYFVGRGDYYSLVVLVPLSMH